ncbi:MAG: elongation factor 4 [Candidatus Taylorbacteria bacterium RIFCSPHIGHO2_01_FULL_46_22b]|uniref:Elongation factor 4 n=1 Tax=Candidatus Taylorbacteria bacterium RIFCSPHIGHO2_01_FULL_46_22b TaxID=1802301 RepID=A0A1G2M363_9BACT|nr:MAG: elongation factor 4 [Candidatus Taylorbacteria bacterium RIFCSPHIGHO2_01_FULL_46_22b]
MELKLIRNFSIIAHIDHGKSTLADRMLEITHTIQKREMREQFLDSMELERERGITIKMKPVRMNFTTGGIQYVINLIDTPGHIDFSYEVSRALKAVEGVVLLVDATQGVQAQTLTTLGMAREAGLTIVPVVSKIDSPLARTEEVKKEIAKVVGCTEEDVLLVSGKTGEGVENLLSEIVTRVPPPTSTEVADVGFRGLIFDFHYSNHTGVIVYMRVFDGTVTAKDILKFCAADSKFSPIEVGIFSPNEIKTDRIGAGEIGYLVTGIKQPGIASVGDTVTTFKNPLPALEGYSQPRPVVWASVYPESQDDFDTLRQALSRLKLSDSSLTFEEESSGVLGRGFRCGFLGMLHLEIVTERLHREFSLQLVVTMPSVTYEITRKDGKQVTAYSPIQFPESGLIASISEPIAHVSIITPPDYLGSVMQLLYDHEAVVRTTETFSDNRTALSLEMPLRELMRNFFDDIKSATSGFASLSYSLAGMADGDVARLDIFVAEELVPAFSRIVSRRRVEHEAEAAVERLHSILPRQMFTTKIQGFALGRIISSRTLSAMKKDVTQHMYGGDITRKMKLREKQKKGKKKMAERGRVNISHDVFLKMVRKDS